ncbi:SDR family oxidoreductase [Streptomyces sp. NPDC059853]|uniref:SDR family oxidoreductase n=1 Tax=Streptomyces sp. NPDC059853 TaxID=3346973 RepID=UPI0036651225
MTATPEQWALLRAPLGTTAVLDTTGADPAADVSATLRAAGLEPVAGDREAAVYCALLLGNEALGCERPSPGLDRERVRRAAEAMARAGAGRLVLITDAAPEPHAGADPVRHARLAADRAWWQQLAVSFAPYGVVANTIVTGYAPFLGHRLPPARLKDTFRYQPHRHPTTPADLVSALRLLTSRGCSYLVAETLRIDGGADLGLIPAIRADTAGAVGRGGSVSGTAGTPAAAGAGGDTIGTPGGGAAEGADVPPRDQDMAGSTVLVVGASSGIGRAVALHLAERGADVVLAARRLDELDAVADEVAGFGRKAWTLRRDLADPDAAASLPGDAWAAAGRIDALAYAAGQLGLPSPAGGATAARTTLSVNFLGFATVTDGLVRRWTDTGVPGAVAGVASVSARFSPVAHLEYYGASKAAMMQYARCLSVTHARHGIRAGCVAPGIIDTPMGGAAGPEHRRGWISRIPAGRVGLPHEVAVVVGHLLSPGAARLTGATPFVDGGFALGDIAPLRLHTPNPEAP